MKSTAGGGSPPGKGQLQQQQQPPTLTRTEEASIRELVESCLVNDDFTPVLRVLFGGPGAFSGPGSSTDPAPSRTDAAGPTTSSGAALAGTTAASRSKTGKQQHSSVLHSGPLIDGRPALELLQSVLRSVAAEQDAVVQDVCSSHAMEIATCVAELDRMVTSAEELRGAVAAGGEELQRTGASLANTARELHGLLSAQRHLAAAVGGLRAVRRLLARCGQVGSLLAERRLFPALQLLEQVRARDLVLALEVLSNNSQAAVALLAADGGGAVPGLQGLGPGGSDAGAAGTGAGGAGAAIPAKQQPVVARLRGFLQGLVADLEAAIEYYAVAEFNNWLVSVRAESRNIGLRAIRKAAIERQMDEDLSAERRTAAAALMARRDASAAAGAVVGAAFRRELAREGAPAPAQSPASAGAAATGPAGNGLTGRTGRSKAAAAAAAATAAVASNGPGGASGGANGFGNGSGSGSGPGPPLDLATLHPGQTLQAIQSLVSRHRAAASLPPPPTCVLSDYTTALLQGLDMQGLHRCVHIHRCLGRMPSLRRYYLDQRRLQITTDLAPPPKFLESYQAYLAQVTGFFVVEDAVRAAAPDLLSSDAAALLWEAAAGSLRGVAAQALDEALGAGAPASIMLLLKDFMLLVCSALGSRGFSTAPITELLSGSRLRYHELLTASVALRVGRALAADSLAEGLEVASPQQAAELAGRLGLPSALDGGGAGGGGSALPCRVPYTSSLPRILQAVRGFVTDSLAYLQGLLSPWELLPAVVQARDRLIAKTVVDALADHTARLLAADTAAAPAAAPGSSSSSAQQQQALQRWRGPGGGGWHVREVMRMITNAWCLGVAMQTLDEWTLLQVRPLGAMAAAAAAAAAAGSSTGGAAPSPGIQPDSSSSRGAAAKPAPTATGIPAAGGGGGATVPSIALASAYGASLGTGGGVTVDSSTGAVLAALRSVQDGGERGLLRLISERAEALVAGARSLNWLPQGPLPPGTSPYAEELLAMLKDTFEAAASILPRSSFLFLSRAVVRSTGNAFMQLLKEGIKAYNMFSIERLAADVTCLDRFIAGCPVPQLAGEFAEPRQLCGLLLSPRVEDVLIPEVRRTRYPSLDLASLVIILERYREQARVGKEKTGHVSKRTLEGIAKQLRGQMVSGTAVSGPRVLEDI